MTLIADLKKAKRGAIAKAITIFENDEIESRKLIKKIYKSSGKSIVIGFTGSAGAGKSSLINKVTIQLKKMKMKPAILAIDPTSHISGGAILGDRVRILTAKALRIRYSSSMIESALLEDLIIGTLMIKSNSRLIK